MSPVRLFLALTAVFVACGPITNPNDDTGGGDVTDPDAEGAAGRLYDVPMSLIWGWNTSEDPTGICLDLKIATNGADVRSWKLDVRTDTPVTDLYYVEGADIRVTETGFTVAPSETPELAGGDQVLAKFCAHPGVRPMAMTAEVAYVDEPDTDPPDQPDPYDFLIDPGTEFGLEFAEEGEENSGKCLRVNVINLSSVPVVDWGIVMTFPAPVGRTASDGLWFYEGDSADQIVIIPDWDSRTIQPFDAETGRVCLQPFAAPIAIRSGDAPDP